VFEFLADGRGQRTEEEGRRRRERKEDRKV
jgi:hypothetical protein